MLSAMRDMPFVDILAPAALGAAVWAGLNVFFIAPQIVLPRMSENVWLPACQAGLQTANAKLEQKRESEINAFLAAKQADKRQIQNSITPLMHMMGEEFALAFGNQINSGFDAMADAEIAKAARDKFATAPVKQAAPTNYCTCIVTELQQDRFGAGLYTASFRLWEPTKIQQLNSLGETLAVSKTCNPKD